MDDVDLAARLADADPVSVTAFPDGSVDRFFAVESGGERVTDRAAFAERVPTDGPTEFDLRRRASGTTDGSAAEWTSGERSGPRANTFPGGHAVNLAEQAAALGDDATVYGHLDHPAFDDLAADAVSMGDPAEVAVLEFDDDDVLLVEDSADLASWTLADLRAAAPDFDAAVTADAVCCVNWASFPAMTDALSELAAADPEDSWFVFDPGALVDESADGIGELAGALAALDDPYDVAVSVNRAELHDLARALDCERSDDTDAVAAVRGALGVSGVVLHARDAAVAATRDRRVRATNPAVETPTHRTGAGDRFDAGLAHGLAAGWGWRAALALANHCGAYYVETGATGDRAALADAARSGDAAE